MIYKYYWLEILSMKSVSFNKMQTINKFVQKKSKIPFIFH